LGSVKYIIVNRDSVSDSTLTSARRRRDRLRRRQDIFLAAEQVFARKGYHDASIEEIARAAEYGTGTVYLYFKDKETLYIELFGEKVRELAAAVRQGVGEETEPLAALGRLIRARMEFFERNQDFFRIYMREGLDVWWLKSRKWDDVRKVYAGYIETLTGIIRRGQQAGQLRPGDSRSYAVALSGIMIQLTRDWFQNQTVQRLTELAPFVEDLFLQGARRKR
jgi:AcrR family transcriptional regulator